MDGAHPPAAKVEIDTAFASLSQKPIDAILVGPNPLAYNRRVPTRYASGLPCNRFQREPHRIDVYLDHHRTAIRKVNALAPLNPGWRRNDPAQARRHFTRARKATLTLLRARMAILNKSHRCLICPGKNRQGAKGET